MPGTSASGSTEIALVDSKIIVDLCAGKFYVDATPTIYIASGATAVLGANVEIINPYGVTVKPYGSNYEIAPSLSGGMDAAIAFNVPTTAGNYQYGKYTVNLKMFDSAGGSWVVTKTISICAPNAADKTKNYGTLGAKISGQCSNGKVFILVDSEPAYKGFVVTSAVRSFVLDYPTGSGLSPITTSQPSFSVQLFEGVYKIEGTSCALYDYTDNVFVKVNYKVKFSKSVLCSLDECCVFTGLQVLNDKRLSDCSAAEKSDTESRIEKATLLLTTIDFGSRCGDDVSDYIEQLQDVLGLSCACDFENGTPIINNNPTTDLLVQGCNVTSEVVGLTTVYTINAYTYVATLVDNGGAFTISDVTLNGCEQQQQFTFNVAVVYSQIKTLANQNNTEADLWAAVVNKSLRDVDPACIGVASLAWQAMTFAEKFEAVFAKICDCCNVCDGTITNTATAESGADAELTWQGTSYSYEVYKDGLLDGTYLAAAAVSGVFTHVFEGGANGVQHTWIIIAKCSDGRTGQTETGTFQYLGCPSIAAPIGATGESAACPFDLTSVSFTIPAGTTVEWHTANNTSAGTIVSNPLAVLGGSYYAFAKDANGCYSGSKRYDLVCTSEASCTAPQNLTISRFTVNNFFVQFQSAAYPPPSNSYTVKRRLSADPDISGSYTTIGSPTWSAVLNRWILIDGTAIDNTLYVYRAISNCGSTEPSIDYTYAHLTCPTLTLTPANETIDYSFVPAGGSVDKYEVSIYDETGTVLIHTDTITPAFSNPITGTFSYLTQSTNYKVSIKTFIGTYSTTCSAVATSTTGDTLFTFAGSGRGSSEGNACADAVSNNRTFYSPCGTITVGCILYTDFAGTTALTGFSFVYTDGSNWDVNSASGQVTASSAVQC